jgi:hypothetical protein
LLLPRNAESVELDNTIHFVQAKVQMKSIPKQKSNHQGGKGQGGKGSGQGKGVGGRGGCGLQLSSNTKAILIFDDKDGVTLIINCAHTVLTSPPLGTKDNASIDVQFLPTATWLAH